MAQLHIELLLKQTDTRESISRTEIEDEFHAFLKEHYVHPVNDGEELQIQGFIHQSHIESARITGVGVAAMDMNNCFQFSDVRIKVHAYELRGQDTIPFTLISKASKDAQAKIINLPHESLVGVWESLEFDQSQSMNPEQILNSVVRTVTLLYQAKSLTGPMDINRVILFHGPPGCGKSTLCRALSHKLLIRLSRTFKSGKLFEINTQDLLSKFYSESSKLVSDMFGKILTMAQDETVLVCVLIDEIESIAASRQHSTRNGECADSVRATNQLLTALDRIRSKPNIIVLCTTNMVESIDTAFLDRLYNAIAVPPPCLGAVYTILSGIFNSLIDAGAIAYPRWTSFRSDEERALVHTNGLFQDRHLPSFAELMPWQVYPESPGPLLHAVVKSHCAGFSGRKLRKLPFLAITMHTWEDQCTIYDAIKALQIAVKSELTY